MVDERTAEERQPWAGRKRNCDGTFQVLFANRRR
jgi:hypothetical protein